jgi:hypothetical protein
MLLTASEEAGFSILLSADQNIWHQNRMAGRAIALVVLGTIHWDTIKRDTHLVIEACDRAGEGFTSLSPTRSRPGAGGLFRHRSHDLVLSAWTPREIAGRAQLRRPASGPIAAAAARARR